MADNHGNLIDDDDDDDEEDEIISPPKPAVPEARPAASASLDDDDFDDDDFDDDDDDDDDVISPAKLPVSATTGEPSTAAAAAAPAAAPKLRAKGRRRPSDSGPRQNEDGTISMGPSFKSLLGGELFPGLVVDQTCVFHFLVDEPQRVERKKGGLIPDSFYTYRVVTTSTMPCFLSMPKQYSDIDVTSKSGQNPFKEGSVRRFAVARRYNDFQWLREALERDYVGVPISPLPEKSNRAALDKVLEGSAGEMKMNQLLEYRQRGLKKFLTSIGATASLAESEHVRAFLTLVREPANLPPGATVTSTPGATVAEEEGAVGGQVVLKATDFTTFVAYRDAVQAQYQTQQEQRGEKSIGRKIEALGNFFSKKFGGETKTLVIQSTDCGVDLVAEKKYFSQFQDLIGEMREHLHMLRETHKEMFYAYRHMAVRFKTLGKEEAGFDPYLNEEFDVQAGLWNSMSCLQSDLLEAESKMVMDGLFNYFNWAHEITTVFEALQNIQTQIGQLSKKSLAGPEALRLNDLRMRSDVGVNALLKELRWFHASKLHDWKHITAVFVNINASYNARVHAVFTA